MEYPESDWVWCKKCNMPFIVYRDRYTDGYCHGRAGCESKKVILKKRKPKNKTK